MVRLESVTPVLPVLDVAEAAARWRRLGFAVDQPLPDYAFVERDGLYLHLTKVGEHPENGDVAVYLYVDDPDELYADWQGVEGRLTAPVDTPWGMREGNYIDPDGILIRLGTRLLP